jgi:hypothetical protein
MAYRPDPKVRRSLLIDAEQQPVLLILSQAYGVTDSEVLRRALDLGLERLAEMYMDAGHDLELEMTRLHSQAAYVEAWAVKNAK